MEKMDNIPKQGPGDASDSVKKIETTAQAFGDKRRTLEEVKAFNEKNKTRIEGEAARRMEEGKPETDRIRDLRASLQQGKEDVARYWAQARLLFVGFNK